MHDGAAQFVVEGYVKVIACDQPQAREQFPGALNAVGRIGKVIDIVANGLAILVDGADPEDSHYYSPTELEGATESDWTAQVMLEELAR